MNAPLLELKCAHQELMTRYVAVLDETRYARWLIQREQAHPQRSKWLKKLPTWLSDLLWLFSDHSGKALRPLVHLFVEGHIRTRLKELSEGYITLRAQASANDRDVGDWARECSDACDKLASTLATWTSIKGAFKLWWPFVLSGFIAWWGATNVWGVVGKLNATDIVFFIWIVATSLPSIFLWFCLSESFGYKREMFIPGFDANERPFDQWSTAPKSNVYLMEDRLFNLLHRRKAREKPWDIYFRATGCFIFGSIPLLALWAGDKLTLLSWLFFGLFWVIGIRELHKIKKRLWR